MRSLDFWSWIVKISEWVYLGGKVQVQKSKTTKQRTAINHAIKKDQKTSKEGFTHSFYGNDGNKQEN